MPLNPRLVLLGLALATGGAAPTDILPFFTIPELIGELRSREVIQGKNWLWLHPHWANVLRLQEEPA